MCALRYAFDASNFVSLFYKIVKADHEVSLIIIINKFLHDELFVGVG